MEVRDNCDQWTGCEGCSCTIRLLNINPHRHIKVNRNLCGWERVIALTCFPEPNHQRDRIIRKTLDRHTNTETVKSLLNSQNANLQLLCMIQNYPLHRVSSWIVHKLVQWKILMRRQQILIFSLGPGGTKNIKEIVSTIPLSARAYSSERWQINKTQKSVLKSFIKWNGIAKHLVVISEVRTATLNYP